MAQGTSTMLNRRSFMKNAATLPALAAVSFGVAANAVAPPIAQAALVPGEAIPELAASAGRLPSWGWWAGHNAEQFCAGPFETKEEALAVCREEGPTVIVEALQGEVRLDVPGSAVVELIDGMNEDGFDPDGDCTVFAGNLSSEAEAELGAMVSAAIRAWVAKHPEVRLHYWAFDATRNMETVPTNQQDIMDARTRS